MKLAFEKCQSWVFFAAIRPFIPRHLEVKKKSWAAWLPPTPTIRFIVGDSFYLCIFPPRGRAISAHHRNQCFIALPYSAFIISINVLRAFVIAELIRTRLIVYAFCRINDRPSLNITGTGIRFSYSLGWYLAKG